MIIRQYIHFSAMVWVFPFLLFTCAFFTGCDGSDPGSAPFYQTRKMETSPSGTRMFTYTYNESGNLVKMEINDMESPVETHVFTYDQDGHLTEDDGWNLGNGAFERKVTYQYDREGNKILETVLEEWNGNTHFTSICEFRYDPGGNLEKEICGTGKENGSESETSWNYSSDGKDIVVEIDMGRDGEIDRRIYRTLDGMGQIVKERTDNLTNGEGIDFETLFTYDGNGNLITEISLDYQDDTSFSKIYTNDPNGNLTRIEYDADNDGITDWEISYSYFND